MMTMPAHTPTNESWPNSLILNTLERSTSWCESGDHIKDISL